MKVSKAACSVCGPLAGGPPIAGNVVVGLGSPRLAATTGSRDEASPAGTPILVSTATMEELRTERSAVDWLLPVLERVCIGVAIRGFDVKPSVDTLEEVTAVDAVSDSTSVARIALLEVEMGISDDVALVEPLLTRLCIPNMDPCGDHEDELPNTVDVGEDKDVTNVEELVATLAVVIDNDVVVDCANDVA